MENLIRDRIRSFIFAKFPPVRNRGVTDKTQLLESSIIDSLGVLEVVAFLEQAFTLKIVDDELTPDNFASIDSMTRFVEIKSVHMKTPVP